MTLLCQMLLEKTGHKESLVNTKFLNNAVDDTICAW